MLAVSYIILPSILKSIHIQKPRKFHNKTLFRELRSPQSFSLDDHHSNLDIDLEVNYLYAILTVDEPVDIYAVATISPELFPNIKNIVIGFDAAQPYPLPSEENGIIKRPGMDLIKTQNNTMIGTTRISWPIEGKYKANFGIEFMNGNQIPTQHSVDIFIVDSKSETISMETNRALLALSIAGYFLGFVNAIKIIIDLWTAQ